ncbi:MAG: hypothetical protein WBA77_00465 [Microcoleaceae cyanobacterium]
MKWNQVFVGAIRLTSGFTLMKYALPVVIHLMAHFMNALQFKSRYCYTWITSTVIRLMAHFVTRRSPHFAIRLTAHFVTAILTFFFTFTTTTTTTKKAFAIPTVVEVVAGVAISQTTEVVLIPGRQSLIEFRNGETIQYISLADVHQIVFNTDLPIDSGQASLIVLKTIEPLRLKGVVETPATGIVRKDYPHETVYPTNLVVVTVNEAGEKRTYTFDLKVSLSQTSNASNSVAIVAVDSSQTQVLTLADGRQAEARDIERGYAIALREGYTTSTDPVIGKIQKFLALARQNVPFLEAAARVELPFEVIEALAEMGLQEVDATPELFPPPLPTEATTDGIQPSTETTVIDEIQPLIPRQLHLPIKGLDLKTNN